MEKVTYLGFPGCIRLSNGTVDVIVTTDVGPRIIRYGFCGGDNILGEYPDETTETELGTFRPYGGNRLWVAPESIPSTYYPDNSPVRFSVEGSSTSIRLTPPLEQGTGLQKEMMVTLDPEGSRVAVRHRIANSSPRAVVLAPWSLTIMRGGGTAIIPQEPYAPHSDSTLLPVRSMTLWSYSDLGDPRFSWGRGYIQMKTEESSKSALKIGVENRRGWAAYLHDGTLFVTRFPYEAGATYPDRNSNNEVFTAGDFLEMETLGALGRLEPGESVEHAETWYLFRDVDAGSSDESLDKAIKPLIERIMAGE